MKGMVAVAVLVAALVTAAALYAAGPRWKTKTRCSTLLLPVPPANSQMGAVSHVCRHARVRTSAWERITGAF